MSAIEILLEMENEMTVNIARLLSAGSLPSAEWQAEKLAALGDLRKANEDAVKKYLPLAYAEAKKEIESAGSDAAALIDAGFGEVGLSASLPTNADERLRFIWAIWETRTQNQFFNLGMSMIDSAERKYIDIVYKTTAEVIAGIKPLNVAISETAATWLSSGLTGLTDAAGREWSVEAYAQVVIQSNLTQVAAQTQFARLEQYDHDLFEVSSHIGARPGCAPYQGKVYSRTGRTPGYPTLQSTSYGRPEGLFGCNCGHYMAAYIPGIKKTYAPYPMRENMKAYAESQTQRRLERGIRSAKREKAIFEATGDSVGAAKAQQKVSNRQAAMREFIKETGRTRRNSREQIQN